MHGLGENNSVWEGKCYWKCQPDDLDFAMTDFFKSMSVEEMEVFLLLSY